METTFLNGFYCLNINFCHLDNYINLAIQFFLLKNLKTKRMIKNYLLAIFLLATILVKAQASTFTISAGTGTAVGSNITVPLNCTATFTATITSGAAGSWNWSASGGMSITNYYFSTPTITFTNTGTYTLMTVATPTPPLSTISDTVRTIINIIAAPSITVANSPICPGGSTTMSVSPGSSVAYSWAPAGNLNVSTGSLVIASPATTTEYTLTASYLYGCPSNSSTNYVTVNSAPVITVTNTIGATCYGVCNGQAGINISNTGGPLSISPSSWIINLYTATNTSLCAGTQSVTVTGGTGCPTTQTLTITQPSSPVSAAINSTVTTCGLTNGSAVATINGGTSGYTFTWTPGNMNTLAVSNLAAGTYSLNVTDANNCIGTATTTIGSSNSPTVSINGTTTICNGNTTTLTASGASTYTWVTGATTASIAVTPTTTTNYSVVGTDANGCTSSTFTYVNVNTTPVITVSTTTGATCYGACNGQANINITGTGGPLSISPSNWSLSGYSATSTSLCAGTQSVTVTGGSGCPATQTLTITQPTAISAVTTVTATSCGQTNGNIAATVSGGTAPYSYTWSPGTATTSSISSLAAGTYNLNVTDSKGCTATNTTVVNASSNATVTISAASASVCAGSSDVLTAAGAVSYTWSSGANTASISVTPTASTNYTVSGTNANGCTNSATVVVTVNHYDNLSGTIYDTTTVSGLHPITMGSVYLYTQQPGGSVGIDTSSLVVSTNTLTGAYTFNQVPPGNYYVKAVASITTYTGSIPTYLSTSPNAYLWSSATALVHSGCTNGNDAGHNITVIELPAQTGTGLISGVITNDVTFGHRLINGSNQVMGAPLKGIDVKLGKAPGGGCAARTTSNSTTGVYTFTNVPNGSYSIYADIPNFGMTTILTVTISPSNLQSTNNNYCVDSVIINTQCVQITGINQLAAMNNKQVIVYPNPNNGIFYVQINEFESTSIEIYNVIGQKVFEQVLQNNLEQINLSTLTEGIYQIKVLKNNNTVYQTKIIKQ